MALKYGASGVKGAEPSFKDHLATAEGQAELRAFVRRVDDRVQQDWNKLPSHLRGGARCNSRACVLSSQWRKLECIFHSRVQNTLGA